MKLSAVLSLLCLAPVADAFVVAPPRVRIIASGRAGASCTTAMASPLPAAVSAVTTVLQTSVVPLLASNGVAEPGTVDAPGWVLPAGAVAVILTAGLIPVLLKVCAGCLLPSCSVVCDAADC